MELSLPSISAPRIRHHQATGGIFGGVKDSALETLQRWETAGGHWQVLSRSPTGLLVALLRCDGGEEAHRFTSADPDLATYIGDRESSELLSS